MSELLENSGSEATAKDDQITNDSSSSNISYAALYSDEDDRDITEATGHITNPTSGTNYFDQISQILIQSGYKVDRVEAFDDSCK